MIVSSQELISVINAAKQLNKSKQTLFKIMRRLKIEPTKQRSSTNRNQVVAYITQDELDLLGKEILAKQNDDTGDDGNGEFNYPEMGVFYLVQLEPSHDPGRFKVGFAVNMSERLRHLKCSAPYAIVRKTWACRRGWEKTAIDSVTVDCERVYTEVFRTTDTLEKIEAKCEQFFSIMPSITASE